MANINQITIDGTTYDIEDTTARASTGVTDDIKVALLNCFQNVAWTTSSGQTYYDALYDALYAGATVESITATYTQRGTVYDTDTLDSLKSDLVVVATYSDNTTNTITSYTLSGTLLEGTSTITVNYNTVSTTFNVTVTTDAIYSLSNTVFDGSSTYYDTGIQLLASDTSFTIFIDFTAGTYSTDSALLHCINETGKYPGFFLGERTQSSTQYFRHAYYASGNATYFEGFDTNEHKYIITHTAGDKGTATYYFDSSTGSTTFGSSTLDYVAVTQNLLIGCYQTTAGTLGRYWSGTVHSCRIWDTVLSDDQITALMGG